MRPKIWSTLSKIEVGSLKAIELCMDSKTKLIWVDILRNGVSLFQNL